MALQAENDGQFAPPLDMFRLVEAGFRVIPLGAGLDGKSPLLRFGKGALPLKQIVAVMHKKASAMYGVRLGDLVVVDVDERCPETFALVERRFGPSPVMLDSPRGRHFYYKTGSGPIPNLRSEGLPIDIKTGVNHYVAGPGSIRPDGGTYTQVLGILGETPLPSFKEAQQRQKTPRSEAAQSSGLVSEGDRHGYLLGMAKQFAPRCGTLTELEESLMLERDTQCETGASPMPNAEVAGIALWTWGKCQTGNLWGGRDNSGFYVRRDVQETLLGIPDGGGDAFLLHTVLASAHGHLPGKTFCISHQGLKDAGRLTLSRRRMDAAIKLLLYNGLMAKVGKYAPGRYQQHYRLCWKR